MEVRAEVVGRVVDAVGWAALLLVRAETAVVRSVERFSLIREVCHAIRRCVRIARLRWSGNSEV